MSTITTPEGQLRMEIERFPIHYNSKMDGDWKFTDVHGHYHYCDERSINQYPTLRRVVDRTYWCDSCEDEHEESHLECKECGDHIVPGKTGPGVAHRVGRTSYFWNDQPITEEQANEIIAKLKAAREDAPLPTPEQRRQKEIAEEVQQFRRTIEQEGEIARYDSIHPGSFYTNTTRLRPRAISSWEEDIPPGSYCRIGDELRMSLGKGEWVKLVLPDNKVGWNVQVVVKEDSLPAPGHIVSGKEPA